MRLLLRDFLRRLELTRPTTGCNSVTDVDERPYLYNLVLRDEDLMPAKGNAFWRITV